MREQQRPSCTASDGAEKGAFHSHANQTEPLAPTADLVRVVVARRSAAVMLRVERQVVREVHGAEALIGAGVRTALGRFACEYEYNVKN